MTKLDERMCAGHENRTWELGDHQMLSSMFTVSLCVHVSGASKVIQ